MFIDASDGVIRICSLRVADLHLEGGRRALHPRNCVIAREWRSTPHRCHTLQITITILASNPAQNELYVEE